MSRKQTTLLGWLVPAVVLILAVAWYVSPGKRHAAPAHFPAAQADLSRAGPPEVVPGAVTERAAGGQLVQGKWQFGYVPNPGGTQQFLKSLPRPTLAAAAPH